MRTTKAQISLCIRAVWSAPLLFAAPPVSITKMSSLYQASVAVQAGLSLTWLQAPKTGFLLTRLKWATSSEFGTYCLCKQQRFRWVCASTQSRQNLHCSLIQAVSREEPSDRKPNPWPLWMAGHAQSWRNARRHKFAWRATNNSKPICFQE